MAETEQAKQGSSKGGASRMKSMTKEQRSEFARQGALAMLEKKRAKQVELTPLETTVSKKSPSRKRRPVKQRVSRNDKVFEQALASAEQEYVIAIKEHADHSAKLALLNMRIPALQRTIAVLRQQQNPGSGMVPYQPYSPGIPQPPTMDQIMSDAPLQGGYVPQQPVYQPAPPQNGPQPIPGLATAPVVPRIAGGGAMDVQLPDPDDDDQHLRESGVAGGNWV